MSAKASWNARQDGRAGPDPALAGRCVCSSMTWFAIRKANEPPKPKHRRGKARRWKVERTHSWLNRARRLLVRWEKKAANYLGFLHLQFTVVTLRTAGVLG